LAVRHLDGIEELGARIHREAARWWHDDTPQQQQEVAALLRRVDDTVRTVVAYRALVRAEMLGTVAESYSPAEAEAILSAYQGMVASGDDARVLPRAQIDRLLRRDAPDLHRP